VMTIGCSRLPGDLRGMLGPGPEARPSSSWLPRLYETDCHYDRRFVWRTLRIQACPYADVASIAEPEAARWAAARLRVGIVRPGTSKKVEW
jgi:hypothetical protein